LSSQHDAKLFGAYTFDSAGGPSLGFSNLVLEADGSFFEDRPVVCIKAPCNPVRAGGIWSSTSYAHTSKGQLTLQAKGEKSVNYQVSIAGDNSSIKLALTTTSTAALYDREKTFCDSWQDCQGQPVPVTTQLCTVGNTHQTFCEQNACVSKCAPPPQCATNADCRLFDDYCAGCSCVPLPATAGDPTCQGPTVQCLREPCGGHAAVCVEGQCSVE
jgi:hypothetical protein